ncbi:MAG: hypothetical protein ACR2NP_15615 [Pirellulaceae bacterium]
MFQLRKPLAALAMFAVIAVSSASAMAADKGPRIDQIDSVDAWGTMTYTLTFKRGVNSRVMVRGDGDTDLDLYIYDANGNLIVADEDYTDNCVCDFLPYVTSEFTIHIVNRGSVYNRYRLMTN